MTALPLQTIVKLCLKLHFLREGKHAPEWLAPCTCSPNGTGDPAKLFALASLNSQPCASPPVYPAMTIGPAMHSKPSSPSAAS